MEKKKSNYKLIICIVIIIAILIASIVAILIKTNNKVQKESNENKTLEEPAISQETLKPSSEPTIKPSEKPIIKPTVNPTVKPTLVPTKTPTVKPTATSKPTNATKVPVQQSAKTSSGVPILCYHGVLDKPWGIQELFVKVDEFEAQMKYLSENGYTPIFVSEIANANNYKKPIIITFDDGYKDVYTNAFPILKKYNMKANVYMISAWIGGDVYMTKEMTKEMANSPLIEIGSHTVTHKALATLSQADIEYELSTSKKALEDLLGKEIGVVAYPTGSYDSRVINIAKKYYRYALSTVNGKENPSKLNTYALRRIYVYRKYNIAQFKNLF